MVRPPGKDLPIGQQSLGASHHATRRAAPGVLVLVEKLPRPAVEHRGQTAPRGHHPNVFMGEKVALGREIIPLGIVFADVVELPDRLAVGRLHRSQIDVFMGENARTEIGDRAMLRIGMNQDAGADRPA